MEKLRSSQWMQQMGTGSGPAAEESRCKASLGHGFQEGWAPLPPLVARRRQGRGVPRRGWGSASMLGCPDTTTCSGQGLPWS